MSHASTVQHIYKKSSIDWLRSIKSNQKQHQKIKRSKPAKSKIIQSSSDNRSKPNEPHFPRLHFVRTIRLEEIEAYFGCFLTRKHIYIGIGGLCMNRDPPSMHGTTSGSGCVFSASSTLLNLLLHTQETPHRNVYMY